MTKQERIVHMEKVGAIVRGCKGCAPIFKDPDALCPRHTNSPNCESGKRPHCTCDRCF